MDVLVEENRDVLKERVVEYRVHSQSKSITEILTKSQIIEISDGRRIGIWKGG